MTTAVTTPQVTNNGKKRNDKLAFLKNWLDKWKFYTPLTPGDKRGKYIMMKTWSIILSTLGWVDFLCHSIECCVKSKQIIIWATVTGSLLVKAPACRELYSCYKCGPVLNPINMTTQYLRYSIWIVYSVNLVLYESTFKRRFNLFYNQVAWSSRLIKSSMDVRFPDIVFNSASDNVINHISQICQEGWGKHVESGLWGKFVLPSKSAAVSDIFGEKNRD